MGKNIKFDLIEASDVPRKSSLFDLWNARASAKWRRMAHDCEMHAQAGTHTGVHNSIVENVQFFSYDYELKSHDNGRYIKSTPRSTVLSAEVVHADWRV
jgi:hypothetical protein